MAQPRYTQFDIEATEFYHCISRCVRRAFLCGQDRFSGRSFDHRKGWVVEKLAELADVFAIEICAYAVMSNHFHVVLRIDSARARGWNDAEVVERYGKLFPWAAAGWNELPAAVAADRVRRWRARLYDMSWFMRCLNESIARRANREDDCKGRFWEGRFRSQALLDQAGLLTCMSYVDLNPIRAGLAETLEESEFTSIQQRLELVAGADCAVPLPVEVPVAETPGGVKEGESTPGDAVDDAGTSPNTEKPPRRPQLVSFSTAAEPNRNEILHLTIDDYVELLRTTAAAVHAPEPTAALSADNARSLWRVGIDSAHWVQTLREYRRQFFSMVGSVHAIDVYCARTDRQQAKGSVWAGRVFRDCA